MVERTYISKLYTVLIIIWGLLILVRLNHITGLLATIDYRLQKIQGVRDTQQQDYTIVVE